MKELTPQQIKDIKILARFIQVYCLAKHEGQEKVERLPLEQQQFFRKNSRICPDCADLLAHGIKKRTLCPLDPKPSCKKCHIHCYSPAYRQKIREIMAYSGRKMLLRGRLDYLWHYFAN